MDVAISGTGDDPAFALKVREISPGGDFLMSDLNPSREPFSASSEDPLYDYLVYCAVRNVEQVCREAAAGQELEPRRGDKDDPNPFYGRTQIGIFLETRGIDPPIPYQLLTPWGQWGHPGAGGGAYYPPRKAWQAISTALILRPHSRQDTAEQLDSLVVGLFAVDGFRESGIMLPPAAEFTGDVHADGESARVRAAWAELTRRYESQ